MQMLYPALCRCIRKPGMPAILKRNPLDLHQVQSLRCLQTEVQTRLAVSVFPPQLCQLWFKMCRPLGKYLVGSLCIHVNQQITFTHSNQIPSRLALGIRRFFQPYFRPRYQQFPAASCVLYMANHRLTVHFYMGDKSVGTVKESGFPQSCGSDRIYKTLTCR